MCFFWNWYPLTLSTTILMSIHYTFAHQGRAGRQFSRELIKIHGVLNFSWCWPDITDIIYCLLSARYCNRNTIYLQYIPTNPFIYLSICRIPWIKVTGYRGYLKKYYCSHLTHENDHLLMYTLYRTIKQSPLRS